MSKAEFELQIKIGSWVTAEWNASIANEFSFLLFLFSNRRYKRQNFFHFRTYKVEFETFAKEFSRKREGILISLQSNFKSNSYQKKFEVVESDSWCMNEWNSVAKSFPTVSERWSWIFFHLCKSKVFKIYAFHFSSFFVLNPFSMKNSNNTRKEPR